MPAKKMISQPAKTKMAPQMIKKQPMKMAPMKKMVPARKLKPQPAPAKRRYA